jgi:hypothetical protein
MDEHGWPEGSASEKNRNWWSDLDDTILECLDGSRVVTTGEIAGKLGVSEAAVSSFLALLAIGDRVRIHAVEGVRRLDL